MGQQMTEVCCERRYSRYERSGGHSERQVVAEVEVEVEVEVEP